MANTTDKSTGLPLTRKEALSKAGKYALFTAAASILILAPKKAVAQSIGGIVNPGFGSSGSDGTIKGQSGSAGQSPWGSPESSGTKSNGLRDSPWK